MNRFDEMYNAMRDAEQTIKAADVAAQKMAMILKGRLRKCDPWVLADLKRELAQFNARTGEWKS